MHFVAYKRRSSFYKSSPVQPFLSIASSLNRWRTSSPEYFEGQDRQVNENKLLNSSSAQLTLRTRYVPIYVLPPSLRSACHIFTLLRSRCSQTAKWAIKKAVSKELFLSYHRWDEWNTTEIQRMKLISCMTLNPFNKG